MHALTGSAQRCSQSSVCLSIDRSRLSLAANQHITLGAILTQSAAADDDDDDDVLTTMRVYDMFTSHVRCLTDSTLRGRLQVGPITVATLPLNRNSSKIAQFGTRQLVQGQDVSYVLLVMRSTTTL